MGLRVRRVAQLGEGVFGVGVRGWLGMAEDRNVKNSSSPTSISSLSRESLV